MNVFISCLCSLFFFLISPPGLQAGNSVYGTYDANPIKEAVRNIQKNNVFVLYVPDETSPAIQMQLRNEQTLIHLATTAELEQLIRTHKNNVVRLYAFKALSLQVYSIGEDIMRVVLMDDSLVPYVDRNVNGTKPFNQLIQNFLQ